MKKNNFVLLVVSVIIALILIRCNQPIRVNNLVDHGINQQILNIVNKIEIPKSAKAHITIWFYTENDSALVKFIDGTFTPLNGKLSEQSYFSGYKKVDSKYLIFIHDERSIDSFNSFVIKDSLSFDSELFDVQDTTKLYRIFEPTQLIYYINQNDSLIFVKEERI